jgi:PAS domain S-box-containing protein
MTPVPPREPRASRPGRTGRPGRLARRRAGASALALDGLDHVLSRAGDGVCAVDGDGRIVLWNRAAERILGYPARDVLGKPCCDVFGGRDDSGNRLCYPGCGVMTLIGIGEPVSSFDMCTRTQAGRRLWLNISILGIPPRPGAAPERDDGRGGLVVHLFRDVTATKELLTLVHERLAAPDPAADPASGAGALTRRELEVLRLLASGANTAVAAERLHVSPATIRNHVQNILAKLGVHSRLQAVAHATRHRLL